ncbi:NUDIX hydrolase [Kribbella sp. NPDC055071]
MHFREYDTRVAGYARIVDEEERVLLTWFVGNDRSTAGWSLPGGGVEFEETVQEAVVREVFEETGYTVDLGELIAVHSFTVQGPEAGPRPYKSVRIIFAATVTGGTLGTTEVGGTTEFARWIPLAEVKSQPSRADIIDVALNL